MSKHLIKDVIIKILRDREDVLLNAFTRFPEFVNLAAGDQVMCHVDNRNWVVMVDINLECVQAFNELLEEGIIKYQSIWPLAAMAGGDIYLLPIADPKKKHRSQHWMPMTALKGSNFPEE